MSPDGADTAPHQAAARDEDPGLDAPDIRLQTTSAEPGESQGRVATAAPPSDEEVVRFIEMLFFAYRDFTAEPDAILQEMGFGRAHHRVLHFVCRRPGLRVADLLGVLKITKQSLARVLRQLIDAGHIEQQPGEFDRRERLLFATSSGQALHARLLGVQLARVGPALRQVGDGRLESVENFLLNIIDPDERDYIQEAQRMARERLGPSRPPSRAKPTAAMR